MYVENTFRSIADMHRVYSEHVKSMQTDEKPVSRKVFNEIMQEMNIAIHSPRKDQCDLCCAWKTGNLHQLEYDVHIEKKNEAREAKIKAKERVSDDTVVVTMDLQSVLLSPRLRASAAYYKQKLQLHDFTIYRLNDGRADLYVWHEGDGGVTANEFISCIVSYIESLPDVVKHIILISDGCGYQNRNKSLCSALSDLAKRKQITIEQLILEKGHTMMECDSVHSTLDQVA